MSTDARKQLSNDQIIERAVRGELAEAQIKELVAREPELAALAFIAAVQAIGQLRSGAASIAPSTPSGQQPVYTKPKQRTQSGEQIGEEAKRSAHLHADETGWRVKGETQWLWCFTNPRCCYFMIDPSRGSPALNKFFTEDFDGVLTNRSTI